ncbi:hypothetical protein JOF53_002205 [Crossiella equi]|uniref:Ran GTPase-activating protein (RanGAP) involved in mRNA processing and transport n=1 Tax=Crossiella equi TaxID=130796 RepID=A0ABS5A9R8_9PSEU|nr:hypothetical protein [Crossiella equi]MBP2473333.1 hypothetical protein [Crossiella equi]
MTDPLAEIETVLTGRPDKLAFRALCSAVLRAGGGPELVASCQERLRSWPDEVRQAPWSWLAALESGVSSPVWPLVRSLDPRSGRDGLRAAALPDPRVWPQVRAVTRVELPWYSPKPLAELAENVDHWPELREVRLGARTTGDDEVLAALAGSAAIPRLTALEVVTSREDCRYFDIPGFPVDRPLRLRHAGLLAPDLTRLLAAGLLPELRSAEVLISSAEQARALADCPQLAALARLAVGFRCGRDGRHPLGEPFFGNVLAEDDEAAEVFFARADLSGLRALAVRGPALSSVREGLGVRGVEAITASGVLGRVTELTLESLPLGDTALAGVLGAVDRGSIEELVLADVGGTDAVAAAFAAAEGFPCLRRLDLRENHLGPGGVRQLTGVPMPALAHLDLSGGRTGSPYYGEPEVQPVGDAGAGALAASGLSVTSLALAATGLGPDGLAAVLGLPLEVLDIAHNPVGELPDGPAWQTLRTVDLTDCALSAPPPSGPRLESVSLAYNSIRDGQALARWPVLPQLHALDLHDHLMSDVDLLALATSGAARRLVEVDLEQDCWNSGRRRYDTPLPRAVVEEAAFPGADSLFLGVVDEYHGVRLSAGLSAADRAELADGARPALLAFLSHLDFEEEVTEEPEVRGGTDFRQPRERERR